MTETTYDVNTVIPDIPLASRDHYTLPLRGNNINAIIDASTPLLGMVLRIQAIDTLDDNPNLYQQIVTDITAIEQSLQDKHYEPGIIVSFRYILCTFIDEVAMKRSWDSKTNWRKESLLVHFHNEAWGGEKIFVLLDRLMGEPHRYKDLLNFFYLCFCLGLRGRYALDSENSEEFNHLFRRLHNQIQSLNNDEMTSVTLDMNFDKNYSGLYKLPKQLTIKRLLLGGILIVVFAYSFYAFLLNGQSQDILKQLNTLLK